MYITFNIESDLKGASSKAILVTERGGGGAMTLRLCT